jgi:hypothetical protein
MAKLPAKQRTTASLRDILFEEIEAARTKDFDPSRARSVAALSREILSTARLELQFHEMVHRMKGEGADVNFAPLVLGSK